MRRPDEDADEQMLFDLPLSPESGPERKRAESKRTAAERPARPIPAPPAVQELPLTPQVHRSGPAAVPARPLPAEDLDEMQADDLAGPGSRLTAGIADLVIHAAVTVGALVGSRLMGARPVLADWPAVLAFVLSFSFLYTVVPLAFWGHTLGMAWAGITARNRDGEPLTFDQTARRWLGGVLTAVLLGLPLLVTGSRRSLTDVVSGSATYPDAGPDPE